MSFINSLFSFFNKLFHRKSNKMLEAPQKEMPIQENKDSKEKFEEILRVDIKNKEKEKNKNQVETLISEGDGLGIQGKINY